MGVGSTAPRTPAQALAGARRLARRAGARLRIITVVEQLAFGAVPVSTMAPAASANRVIEEKLSAVHDAALTVDQGAAGVEGVFREGR